MTTTAAQDTTFIKALKTWVDAETKVIVQGPVVIPPTPIASGWTVFTATAPSGEGSGFSGAGTRIIYVSSSSGNAGNPGTLASPVATVEQGFALLRPGKPDWLLLKKGDTWTNSSFDFNSVHGASATTNSDGSISGPVLISSYPSTVGARPLINYSNFAAGPSIASGAGTFTGSNYCAIVGIEWYANTRDPSSPSFSASDAALSDAPAMGMFSPSTWFLLEDCKFSFFTENIVMHSGGTTPNTPIGKLTLNRCVSHNAYCTNLSNPHGGQGCFVAYVNDLSIIECVFDHNGWNDTLDPRNSNNINTQGNGVFKHNCYLGADTSAGAWNKPILPITAFRGNITARACSHGLQGRPGGTVEANLFLNNPIADFTGPGSGGDNNNPTAGGNNAGIQKNNVSINATDIGPSLPRNYGLEIQTPNSLLDGNIVAHTLSSTPSVGFGLNLQANPTDTGSTLSNNIIYDLGSSTSWYIQTDDAPTLTNNTTLVSGGSYSAPSRDAASYNASLGGTASIDAYMTECKKQSKDNWRPAYTAKPIINYIRAGFNLGAI